MVGNLRQFRLAPGAGILLGISLLCLQVAAQVEVVGNLVVATRTTLDGVQAAKGTAVLTGTELSTGQEGASLLTTLAGDQITVGAETRVKLERKKDEVRLTLRRGSIAVKGSSTQISCLGVDISPAHEDSAVWEVTLVTENTAQIAVTEGTVNAQGRGQTVVVPAGQRVLVIPRSRSVFRKLLGLPARAGGAAAITIPLALAGGDEEVMSPSTAK